MSEGFKTGKVMDLFKSQKVIVTGATRGIGKAIATAFLEQGAVVLGIYGGNREAAEQFKAQCSANGQDVSLFCCDVSDEHGVKSFFKQVEDDHGSLDIEYWPITAKSAPRLFHSAPSVPTYFVVGMTSITP